VISSSTSSSSSSSLGHKTSPICISKFSTYWPKKLGSALKLVDMASKNDLKYLTSNYKEVYKNFCPRVCHSRFTSVHSRSADLLVIERIWLRISHANVSMLGKLQATIGPQPKQSKYRHRQAFCCGLSSHEVPLSKFGVTSGCGVYQTSRSTYVTYSNQYLLCHPTKLMVPSQK
jgi:hypothetical protein